MNKNMERGYKILKKLKLDYIAKRTILYLIIISSVSLFIRLYYFPFDIPLTHDAVGYFWYAIETNVLGYFPSQYPFPNTGWPIFLSLIFGVVDSNNFIDYMTIQRLATIIISTLTIIPVYFLCRKFFSNSLSIIGVLLFAFEPHMIQHSILGLTDTLYILLIISSFLLIQSSNKKLVYFSFVIAALSALVRYEGLLFLIVLTVIFFIRFRKESKVILNYILAFGIYVLALLPILLIRIHDTGDDGLISHVIGGAKVTTAIASSQSDVSPDLTTFLIIGFQNLIKYTGWVMIPYFVIFAPIGLILGIKKKNPQYFYVIISIIILSIPSLYAYSREIQDTRYLLVLMPFFTILSLFLIEYISNKTNRRKLFFIIFIIIIFISSCTFLEIKKVDLEHEREAVAISQEVMKLTKVTNVYLPESKYLKTASIDNNFPVIKNNTITETRTLNINNLSIIDFIKNNEKNNITHIVVDDNTEFENLNNLFLNDEKYPYLIKVYDSLEHGFKYHVKIYKIDYQQIIENFN
jgi:uncharacterized membrane protein